MTERGRELESDRERERGGGRCFSYKYMDTYTKRENGKDLKEKLSRERGRDEKGRT